MELKVFTTNVELQDIPSYTTNITVEGQVLKLSFMWNERIGKRTLYITDSADQCYLQNTILHPNEPFELNANAVFNDLPYSVTLIKTGDQKRVGNIFNWSKDFILCFSRTVDLEVEKLNVTYGVTTPSTPTIPPIVNPPVGANISCDEATPQVDFDSFSDISSIEVNGVLYEKPTNQTITYFLRNHPELEFTLDADVDYGRLWFRNLTGEYLRVKLVLGGEIFSDSWVVSEYNSNPTVNVDSDAGVVSFCLSPIA